MVAIYLCVITHILNILQISDRIPSFSAVNAIMLNVIIPVCSSICLVLKCYICAAVLLRDDLATKIHTTPFLSVFIFVETPVKWSFGCMIMYKGNEYNQFLRGQ